VQANRASVRREVVIRRPAETVWRLVGDPGRVQEWFPGIDASEVSGDERVVTLHSGRKITERIVTLDPLERRFQYEIVAPPYRFHLSTLDVIELDEETCLVVSGIDADPAPMALILGGAAGAALLHLAALIEEGT
jgi:hypothetical protein